MNLNLVFSKSMNLNFTFLKSINLKLLFLKLMNLNFVFYVHYKHCREIATRIFNNLQKKDA